MTSAPASIWAFAWLAQKNIIVSSKVKYLINEQIFLAMCSAFKDINKIKYQKVNLDKPVDLQIYDVVYIILILFNLYLKY